MVLVNLILTVGTILAISLVPLGFLLRFRRRTVAPIATLAFDTPSDATLGTQLIRQSWSGRLAAVAALIGIIASLTLQSSMTRTSENWFLFLPAIAAATISVLIAGSAPRPLRRQRPHLQLDPKPRNIWSFGPGWWFVGWKIAAMLLVATIIAAGLTSSTDEYGNYALLTVKVGTISVSTSYFGWFYGVPVLAALVLLALVTALSLWAGARPAIAPEARSLDIWIRRVRAEIILMLGTGSLVFTLGLAASSIAGSGRLASEIPTETIGRIDISTPYVAFAWPIGVAGIILQAVGLAVVLALLFSPRPLPRDHVEPETHTASPKRSRR